MASRILCGLLLGHFPSSLHSCVMCFCPHLISWLTRANAKRCHVCVSSQRKKCCCEQIRTRVLLNLRVKEKKKEKKKRRLDLFWHFCTALLFFLRWHLFFISQQKPESGLLLSSSCPAFQCLSYSFSLGRNIITGHYGRSCSRAPIRLDVFISKSSMYSLWKVHSAVQFATGPWSVYSVRSNKPCRAFVCT